MARPDSHITEVDREESGPGASVSTEYVAPVSKSMDWHPIVIDTRGSSDEIRTELVWGFPATFSPDYLESPTPEIYASGGSLSSSVVLCRPDMKLGVA